MYNFVFFILIRREAVASKVHSPFIVGESKIQKISIFFWKSPDIFLVYFRAFSGIRTEKMRQ